MEVVVGRIALSRGVSVRRTAWTASAGGIRTQGVASSCRTSTCVGPLFPNKTRQKEQHCNCELENDSGGKRGTTLRIPSSLEKATASSVVRTDRCVRTYYLQK